MGKGLIEGNHGVAEDGEIRAVRNPLHPVFGLWVPLAASTRTALAPGLEESAPMGFDFM